MVTHINPCDSEDVLATYLDREQAHDLFQQKDSLSDEEWRHAVAQALATRQRSPAVEATMQARITMGLYLEPR